MSRRKSIPVVRSVRGLQKALCALALAIAMPAHADDKNDENRVTVVPSYSLTDDHRWIGIGYVGYVWSNDEDYTVDYLGFGAIWNFKPNWEMWFLMFGTKTDNESSPDVTELRPIVALKNYFTKTSDIRFYNMARAEYRMQDRESPGTDTEYFRLRDRLGVEFAFGHDSRWYGIADVEPFYRFDRDTIDPLRLRAGLGWTINQYVRAELIYHMQFTRPSGSDGLEWTDNIWRLNFKVARQRGVLQNIFGGDVDE
jgi:hypothetical protein